MKPPMELKPCPFCGAEAILETRTIENEYLRSGNHSGSIACSNGVQCALKTALGHTKEEAIEKVTELWNTRHKKKTLERATSQFNSITNEDIPQWMYHVKHSDCLYSVGQHIQAIEVLKDYIKVFRLYDAENLDFSVSGIGSLKGSPFIEFNNHDYPKEERIDLMEWLNGKEEVDEWPK